MWTAVYFLLGWGATESTTKIRKLWFHPSFSHLPYNSEASPFSCSRLPTWDRKYSMIFFSQSALKHKGGSIQIHYWRRLRCLWWCKVCSVLAFPLKGQSLCTGEQHCFQVSITEESFYDLVAPTRALQTGTPEEAAEAFLHGLLCPGLQPTPVPWARSPPRDVAAAISLPTDHYFSLNNAMP